MDAAIHVLVGDLRHLIASLGKDGGQVGPSIYDTAALLRLLPATQTSEALDWLAEQQRPDGGWGDAAMPLTRDVETLAAVLTLHTAGRRRSDRRAVEKGLAFLRRTAPQWAPPLPEDIPLGAELVVPAMLVAAEQANLDVPAAEYEALVALGRRRRELIRRLAPRAGTTASHSWEGWGDAPDPALLDASGSIGHSCSATAAWIAKAEGHPELADAREAAQRYLERAAEATGTGVPYVVPAVWPFPRNEQIVSLFAIQLAGVLDHPALLDVVEHQALEIWRSLRPEGQGISDWFAPDGDNTAMLLSVAAQLGLRTERPILSQYIRDGNCLTYPNELQRSRSATAHAAYALAMQGGDATPLLETLLALRLEDGRWGGDKWHASWLYLTSHTIHALIKAGRGGEASASIPALLDHQRPDGSWGVTAATAEETAYGVVAMLGLERAGLLPPAGRRALRAAGEWLCRNYRPLAEDQGACWIAKGLYRPRRISRAIEGSALLAYLLIADQLR